MIAGIDGSVSPFNGMIMGRQGCVTHRLEIKTMTSSTHFPFPLCCFWNVQRALFNMIDKCGWIHNKLCLSFYKTPSLALKKTKAKWNSCQSVQLYLVLLYVNKTRAIWWVKNWGKFQKWQWKKCTPLKLLNNNKNAIAQPLGLG